MINNRIVMRQPWSPPRRTTTTCGRSLAIGGAEWGLRQIQPNLVVLFSLAEQAEQDQQSLFFLIAGTVAAGIKLQAVSRGKELHEKLIHSYLENNREVEDLKKQIQKLSA